VLLEVENSHILAPRLSFVDQGVANGDAILLKDPDTTSPEEEERKPKKKKSSDSENEDIDIQNFIDNDESSWT
jgi:hypothetical protein